MDAPAANGAGAPTVRPWRQPTVRALATGECQVWWATPAVLPPQAVPDLTALLTDTERTRLARFRRAEDQARYLTSRALLRIVLAGHLGVRPHDIRFGTVCRHCDDGSHGKPYLAQPPEPLEVSVSHSGDRVAVAVGHDPLGIDVEQIASRVSTQSLVERVLSPAEQLEISRWPEPDRLRAFLTYWTRKEALVKATGHGLAVSLADLTVTAPDAAPQLVSWAARQRLAAPARLRDLDAGPGHVAALALLTADDVEVGQYDGQALLTGHSPA